MKSEIFLLVGQKKHCFIQFNCQIESSSHHEITVMSYTTGKLAKISTQEKTTQDFQHRKCIRLISIKTVDTIQNKNWRHFPLKLSNSLLFSFDFGTIK